MVKNNKVFGGTLIVAGITIGAGMLALPIVSSGLGFFSSICLMTIMWLVSLFSALITVEIIHYYGRNVSIPYLSGKVLGSIIKFLGSAALLVLLYSVLSAYISGLASIASKNLSFLVLKEGYFALIITVLSGCILFLSISTVDYVNRVLFITKIILFFLVIFTFIPYVRFENFASPPSSNNMSEILLVFFTSFGFHGSIPTVMKYVGNDIKSLRKVFVFGSLIPLLVYIVWQTITLGVLPFEGMHSFSNVLSNNSSVGVFIHDLSVITNKEMLAVILDGFSLLAMLTSVIGVALGLFDYILESCKYKMEKYTKIKGVILTLGIPLIFSVYFPSGFILALNFAAIALVVLAIILPVLIALKTRKDYKKSQYQVFGGNILLYFALIIGVLIIGLRVFRFL